MPDHSDYWWKYIYPKLMAASKPNENAGRLVYVQHETEMRLGHYKKLPDFSFGLPETYKQLYDKKYALGNSTLGIYVYHLLQLVNADMNSKDFQRNYRQLLDHDSGFNNKNDDAGGAMENLYCPGKYRTTGRTKRGFLEVYAIDFKNPPKPSATPDMTLHFYPVIHRWDAATKTSSFIEFPQFGGNCPLPLIGDNGRAWIRSKNVVFVDSIQAPYTP